MNFRTVLVVWLALVSPYSQCEEARVDQNNLSTAKQAYKAEFLSTMSELIGKEIDPNDPKANQAAEAFFAVDSAKAYAFARIHGVSLEFCPNNELLRQAMDRYRRVADQLISQGAVYYEQGFDFGVGSKRMTKSGQELRNSLSEMLDGIRKEYRDANPDTVLSKCKESVEALTELARFFGGSPGTPPGQ